jgi:hypothetical protein
MHLLYNTVTMVPRYFNIKLSSLEGSTFFIINHLHKPSVLHAPYTRNCKMRNYRANVNKYFTPENDDWVVEQYRRSTNSFIF